MNFYKQILLFFVLSLITVTTSYSKPMQSSAVDVEEIFDATPTFVSAGQKIFKRFYLDHCAKAGVNGTQIAHSKDQEQWNNVYLTGGFGSMLITKCKLPDGVFNAKHTKYLIHFFWYNAKGSGNVPDCS